MIRELLPPETGLAFEAMRALRTGHALAWGHYLYVDDLSTHPDSRRRGHANALLEWLLEEARRLDCDQLHLDSGVELDRADAHRLYLNAGLVISAHHFAARRLALRTGGGGPPPLRYGVRMASIQQSNEARKDSAAMAEEIHVQRLRDDARRPMSINLAEGIALSHKLMQFVGAARPQ